MSMSLHVEALKPPDDDWKKMKAAYEACHAAKVPTPPEISKFFRWQRPDPAGVVVPEHELNDPDETTVQTFNEDGREGFVVDLAKLPKDVKLLRFYASF